MTKNHPGKDIRQSAEFASFMQDIGWQVVHFQNRFVYLRRFPFIGNFAKCPRPDPPLSLEELTAFIKENRIFRFKISPNLPVHSAIYRQEKNELIKYKFLADSDPYNPTTTILVNLTRNEDTIFWLSQKIFLHYLRFTTRRRICFRTPKLSLFLVLILLQVINFLCFFNLWLRSDF